MNPGREDFRIGENKEFFNDCMNAIPMSEKAVETCEFGCELYACYDGFFD